MQLKAAILAVLCMYSFSAVSAVVSTFTDRDAWRLAAGGLSGDQVQDFNGFAQDTVYEESPVVAGFLTLTVPNPRKGIGGVLEIDAPHNGFLGGTVSDVDGTAYAVVGTVVPNAHTLMTFGGVVAIGFDIAPATEPSLEGKRQVTTSLGDLIEFDISSDASFLGILYEDGELLTGLDWGQTGFLSFAGVDNVEAYTAFVPLPAPVLLLLSAVGVAFVVRRRGGRS